MSELAIESPSTQQEPVPELAANATPEALKLFPQAKNESDRAYEAFRIYLELGPKRRYAAVGRKVGVTQRTVRSWAAQFDWRSRINSYTAQSMQQFAETELAAQREDLLDASTRNKAFRDRQYSIAEAFLDSAERYLEHIQDDDLDLMSFADACKALDVASRAIQNVAKAEAAEPQAPDTTLRDQLTYLLEKAYGECVQVSPTSQPQPLTPSPTTA